MKWRDLSNREIVDMIPYVKNYLEQKPDTQLFVGADSQNRNRFTIYAVVIVLYNERKGGKVLYCKFRVPRIQDKFQKLWKEIELAIQIADELKENDINKTLITIDVDFNPDKKYYSNKLLTSAIGWATSLGYICRAKPEAYCASYVADMIIRK